METVKQKIFQSQTKDLSEKGFVKIAVNAFNNTDSDNDVSLPGAFKKTLKEHFDRVRWFLNHDTTQLLGVPIKGYETSDYLIMEAQFNLEKQIGRDTYEDYKLYKANGKSLEHSIGVQAIKYQIDEQKGTRQVSEWKLWEFSTLTHWGSNDNTPLLNIKSMDELKELIEKMANNTRYSDERKREIENTHKALFIKPSNMTLKNEAAMREITREFLTSNLLRNLKF
jgi:HK97 family phage prohead protease